MKRKLLSEEAVKDKLQISDFRSISKEKLIEFVSAIPEMDTEVALKCIEQFPNFKEYSTNIVQSLYGVYEQALSSGRENDFATIDSYRQILDDLRFMLSKDDLSESTKRYIIDKEIEVADKLAAYTKDSKNFLRDLLKYSGAVATGALSVGAALLGVKFFKKD